MQIQTLRQKAYLSLTHRLAIGELVSGTPLTEASLAKELGMSRTPIREAIRQMEMEGFVEYAPRFGAVVRVPEREELADMFTVREALESYAAAEAARRIGDRDLAQLEVLLGRMNGIEAQLTESGEAALVGPSLENFLGADLEFHQIIVRASGNRYMARILDGTRLLSRIFHSTLWVYDRPALAQANRFHARLFEALRQRDAETARACTIEAIQLSRKNALERWDQSHPNQGAPRR